MKNIEEHELNEWKNHYESVDVTDQELDQAIHIGLNKAKRHSRTSFGKLNIAIISVTAAAILFILFFAALNVSKEFNETVSNIPGLNKVVGLGKSNIEQTFYEKVGVTEQEGIFSLSIDGVLRDKYGMKIDYTIKADTPQERLELREVKITDRKGSDIDFGSTSFGSPSGEKTKVHKGTIEFMNPDSDPIEATTFILTGIIASADHEEEITIEFEATHSPDPIKLKINQDIYINDQKLTISEVIRNPLRTSVKVIPDPNNTMKIFDIEDLRIVDNKGNEWTKVSNGLVASGPFDDDSVVYYLEGNYFEDASNLKLKLSKLQAIEKEISYLQLDLKNEKIIKNPNNKFFGLKKMGNGFEIKMNVKEDFTRSPLSYGVYDLEGNKIDDLYSSSYSPGQDGTATYSLFFNEDLPDLITVELSAFPNWIVEEKEIILK
ncbi:DUF5643 domain-containing protein [Bacillaceae bacterium W0354]